MTKILIDSIKMEGKEMSFVGKEGFKVKTSRVSKTPTDKEGKEEEVKEEKEIIVFPSDHYGLVGIFAFKE